jgi:hypothetical protein
VTDTRLIALGIKNKGKAMTTDDPERFGKLLVEKNPRNTTIATMNGVIGSLLTDIYRLFVERGIITQGDAIARLERLSSDASEMASDPGLAVMLIDHVRNAIANEFDRKPS